MDKLVGKLCEPLQALCSVSTDNTDPDRIAAYKPFLEADVTYNAVLDFSKNAPVSREKPKPAKQSLQEKGTSNTTKVGSGKINKRNQNNKKAASSKSTTARCKPGSMTAANTESTEGYNISKSTTAKFKPGSMPAADTEESAEDYDISPDEVADLILDHRLWEARQGLSHGPLRSSQRRRMINAHHRPYSKTANSRQRASVPVPGCLTSSSSADVEMLDRPFSGPDGNAASENTSGNQGNCAGGGSVGPVAPPNDNSKGRGQKPVIQPSTS